MNKDPKIEQEATNERQKQAQKYNELMKPLFDEARSKGLWFYTHYQSLWFSPSELEEKHKAGELRWGRDNWRLRDPQEMIKALKKRRKELKKQIIDVEQRIENEKASSDQN